MKSTSSTKTIRERIEELPHAVYKNMYSYLIAHAQVDRHTCRRVLDGKSQNLNVLMALAKYLHCSIEEILDPDHPFTDPRKDLGAAHSTAQHLGLSRH